MPSFSFFILLPALLSSICYALPEKRTQLRDSSAEGAIQRGNYEYIVVGSGAGGGPLAARLALNGKRVLLIDAGDDQGENLNVQVPTFHAYSTEDPKLAWDFYVKHYTDPEKARMDSKMTWITPSGQNYVGKYPPPGSKMRGILYPRAGTIGGCTAHNALVNVYPHERDWEHIQELTGDATWNPGNMRRIYEKLENVDYLTFGSPGHGYDGWLGVGRADIKLSLNDTKLLAMGISAAGSIKDRGPIAEGVSGAANLGRILAGDVNNAGRNRDEKEGVYNIPLAEKNSKRNGAREFVKRVYDSRKYPLDVMMNTLVTKVIFDENSRTPRAMGVEYLQGKSLYRADPRSSYASSGTPGRVMASAEVILSGGAFNTPQLLKLSGIGPAAELARFNIPLVRDLPGVGTNLQDHFETAVIHEAEDPFASIDMCTYNRQQPDPCLQNWSRGKGPYASSNGFIYSVIKKSTVATQDPVYNNEPDLLIFGGLANFRGYYPGYSNDVYGYKNWTWVVLKAHTGNIGPRSGSVNLVSADPRDVPDITFNYFGTGERAYDAHERDLQAMMEGVRLSREISEKPKVPLHGRIFSERVPGYEKQSDAQLKEHIEAEAWGHHASCTVPIGRDSDPMAVLDSKFRVRGVDGLRVIDASVFPRIPGYFIAVPTYMVGEKAAESILFGK